MTPRPPPSCPRCDRHFAVKRRRRAILAARIKAAEREQQINTAAALRAGLIREGKI